MGLALGLLYDRVRWEEKVLVAAARSRDIPLKLLDAKNLILRVDAGIEKSEETFGQVVLQRCVSHVRGLHLTAFLEADGIEVINPFRVSEACSNKFFTTLALEKAGVPTPRTSISFDGDSALRACNDLGFPVILKPVIGSWGRLVTRLRDEESARDILGVWQQTNDSYTQIYYIQEMVKRPPRDIRAIVNGDRIIAAVYRNSSPGEWRTNVARGATTSPYSMTSEFEEIVHKAADAVGGGVLGVDVMESENGYLVNEINTTVEFRGASSATTVDIPGAILDYALTKLKK